MSAPRTNANFSWLDIWDREHFAAIAKTEGHDALAEIGTSLNDAIANGETFDAWSKKLIPALQAMGWGRRATEANAEERLAAIHDANLQASYAASRSSGTALHIRPIDRDVAVSVFRAADKIRTRGHEGTRLGRCVASIGTTAHKWLGRLYQYLLGVHTK